MTTLTPTPTPQRDTAAVDPDGARGAWLLVMQREIVVRALNKSFVFGLVVSVGVLAALAGFFAWQGSRVETTTVAVSSADTTGAAAVATAAELADDQGTGDEIVVLETADDAAARTALTAGDADAWLHPGDDGWVLTAESTPDGTLTRLVTAGVEAQVVGANAAAAGTSVEELSAGSTLTTEQLDPAATDAQTLFFASFALSLLFFTGALTSGTMIAGSVVEEKQSRLVEIIATAVPLRQLLAGKILGNSVIAVGQTLLFAGVGLVAVTVSPISLALPALSTSLVWFVLFFAVGFLALAALFASPGRSRAGRRTSSTRRRR